MTKDAIIASLDHLKLLQHEICVTGKKENIYQSFAVVSENMEDCIVESFRSDKRYHSLIKQIVHDWLAHGQDSAQHLYDEVVCAVKNYPSNLF